MIYDTIANIDTYAGINPRIAEGLALLKDVDFANAPAGRTNINDNLYYSVMDYEASEGGRLEAHDIWADIQFVACGSEYIGVSMRSEMGEPTEERPASDVCFYEGEYAKVELGGDKFIVLYPQDVHAPGIAKVVGEKIRRVVIKVRLS